MFFSGIALVVAGLRIARLQEQFNFALPEFLALLERELPNLRELAVGGGLAAGGAILAAAMARGGAEDAPGDLRFPVPCRTLDRSALGLLALAISCIGGLAWLLVHAGYSGPLLGLFFGALGLAGLGVRRMDGPRRGSSTLAAADFVLAASLASLSCGLNGIGLTHWYFTAVGDEGEFYWLARAIHQGTYAANPFNLAGVYGDHPVADSLIQAAGMAAFGENGFGWRMSEVLVVGASTALVVLLAKLLFGRIAATVAGLVLGCSHYLMSFTRIAYNNDHCILYCLLAMTMLALAWRSQRAIWLFWSGCALGLCVYTFAGALLLWPLVFLVWAIALLQRPARGLWISALILMLGFAMVVLPGLAATGPGHLWELFLQHGPRQVPGQPAPWLTSMLGLMHAGIAFWVNARWSHHFTAGPLLDSVSGVALLLGLGIALSRVGRAAQRLALLWFCCGTALVAFTSASPQPYFTRLMFVLPAIALLAGVSAQAMAAMLTERLRLHRMWAWAPAGFALALLPALNLQQLWVLSPSKFVTNPETLTRKVLQDYPASVVVEVCAAPNQVRELFLSMHPDEAARFRFSTTAEIEVPPEREGPGLRFPIYLVHARELEEALREKLGDEYHAVEEWDGAHATRATVLLPDTLRIAQSRAKRGSGERAPKVELGHLR